MPAGALELANVPYAGPTLEAAVLAMNKAVTKSMLRAAQVPVLDDLTLRRSEYEREGPDAIVAKVKARFGLPVYAKPASLGSSVGVSRCADDAALADALQLAFELDRVALVEPAIEGGMEINCAVLGRPGAALRTSACEQPIASAEFLSFEDKYMREGGGKGDGALKTEGMSSADRIIPAPISDEMTGRVQELARRTFEALGCTGVARVDLLVDAQERLFVNEPNTIPGSFSFYLWEPVGLAFPDLLDELIDIAMAEHAEKQQTTRTFSPTCWPCGARAPRRELATGRRRQGRDLDRAGGQPPRGPPRDRRAAPGRLRGHRGRDRPHGPGSRARGGAGLRVHRRSRPQRGGRLAAGARSSCLASPTRAPTAWRARCASTRSSPSGCSRGRAFRRRPSTPSAAAPSRTWGRPRCSTT